MSRLHRSSRRLHTFRTLRLAALAGALTIAGLGVAVPTSIAAPTSMVDLGQASTYAALSGASVGNTVSAFGAPHTTLRGDLGVKAAAAPTGFPPGVVTGATRIGTAAAQAHADLVTAYDEVEDRTGGAALAGALAGTTVTPGLHTIAGAASNTTTLTLDALGNPNAVFVFQVGGALAFAAGSHVVLAGGAQASRVFWQVNGAGAVGAGAGFTGTLMALDAVAIGNGSVVNGRLFARNGALTLDADEIYSGPPAVTIAGGDPAFTPDTTPTISGTTDVETPAVVSVSFAGQTLTAIPAAGGAWSVTSAIRPNGAYPVVASVTDGAGNLASATQQLTIDTVLPIVTLDDGPTLTTNDPTPTIAGTSDVAPGTVVHVTVGTLTRTAVVQSEGAWNVTPAALTDGTRVVTASVLDPAGNEGSASQLLTVDTAAPVVSIAGGANALTNDPTPAIAGTAAVAPGTTVNVRLADETLTGPVGAGGNWSVIAAALSDGAHRVELSVSDAAGNVASFTQWLTVDTVSPVVAIAGGATASTTDDDPTIVGTSDAMPGTVVTVSIAGQSMTTLVQANGTWNATPTFVGAGAWPVLASAPDLAGNVGHAGQTLTIAAASPTGTGTGGTVQPVTPVPPAAGDPAATDAPVPPDASVTPAPDGGASTGAAATTTVARDATQKVTASVLVIGTKVTAPARGAVVVTAKGTVRIMGVKKAIKLTSVTVKVPAGKGLILKLKPQGTKKAAAAALRKIRTAIGKGTNVTATITLRIVDAAGNTRNVTRRVKLSK